MKCRCASLGFYMILSFLAACSGAGGEKGNAGGVRTPTPSPVPTVPTTPGGLTLPVTVTGLNEGTLTLHAVFGTGQASKSEDLSLSSSGSASFLTEVPDHSPFFLDITGYPPSTYCEIVGEGPWEVMGPTPSPLEIACQPGYYLRGKVEGLHGGELKLNFTYQSPITLVANGDFQFDKPFPAGEFWGVSVESQPEGQICGLDTSSNTGTVGSSDVELPIVSCYSTQTIPAELTPAAAVRSSDGTLWALGQSEGTWALWSQTAWGTAWAQTKSSRLEDGYAATPVALAAGENGAVFLTGYAATQNSLKNWVVQKSNSEGNTLTTLHTGSSNSWSVGVDICAVGDSVWTAGWSHQNLAQVYKSTIAGDNGAWNQIDAYSCGGMQIARPVQMFCASSRIVIVGECGDTDQTLGVYVRESTDGGTSWRTLGSAPYRVEGSATMAHGVWANGDAIVSSISANGEKYLHTSVDGGSTWSDSVALFSGKIIYTEQGNLLIDGFRSRNFGASWARTLIPVSNADGDSIVGLSDGNLTLFEP